MLLTLSSYFQPDPGKFQTAWSGMGTLERKDLVIRRGHPSRFSLSDEGIHHDNADKRHVHIFTFTS